MSIISLSVCRATFDGCGCDALAERKSREEADERDGRGPGGYKWRQWDHLKEERRRTEIETQGRASVADLYE